MVLLFASFTIWGGKIYAQTTTQFGSGSTCTVQGDDVLFLINTPGDLSLWTDQSVGNNKNIIIKTAEGVVLNEADLNSLLKVTYGNADYYYDLSQASIPAGTKLSEKFNGQQTSYILSLNSPEAASEFTGSKYYVMYTDGNKTEVVVKNGGVAKAASVSYMASSKEIVLDGETRESIELNNLTKLEVLDISSLTLQNNATVTVADGITKINVPQGFDKTKVFPETVREKVTEVIPKEDQYIKNGNGLTVNLEEGMSLRDVLNEANMPYVSNLTIKTVGNRKLTSDDISTINDLKFKYTSEVAGDKSTLWQDATLNLEGCTIDDYDILKSLSNNASTIGEEKYTGIRNVILPSGLNKSIVNAEHFIGLNNMNAAISVAEDQSALVGYVAIPGGLSTTMYQYPKFRQNSYVYLNNNERENADGKSSASKLESLTLSGTLLPSDFATINTQEKLLDDEGHLSYKAVPNDDESAYTLTATGTKSFAEDTDSRTTQALMGVTLTDIDLEDAVFEDYMDMNFNILGHASVVNVKLPTSERMTEIPPFCMNQCTKVEKLIIPGNYKILGIDAFGSMHGLNTLEMGAGVRTLGSHCFEKCDALTQVALPVGMEIVGKYAFINCNKIKDLNIPYGVKTIEAHAFENLDGLTAVRLPYTLETIGDYAFTDCNYINTITIPANVKTIGDGAFLHTNSLRDIYMLGKEAPTIYDYEVDADNKVVHVGTFDEMTLNNAGATRPNGTITATQLDYWRNFSESNPIGKGAAMLHYPTGCQDQYTNKARNDKYGAALVDEKGKPIIDDDGEVVRAPINEDVKDDWYANNKGWARFMLSIANQTGDDNSSVWTVRHMYDDTWYTMCFPFDITINQLISTFGSGFELAYFCGVQHVGDNIVLQFTESNYMKNETYDKVGAKAGVPYMIHPKTGTPVGKKTVFVFSGVSPDLENNPVKGMKGYDYGEAGGPNAGDKPEKYDTDSYTFIGSYGTLCKEGEYFVDKHNEYVEGENPVLQYKVGNATGTYHKDMPKNLLVPRAIPEGVYFLGLAKNATYPKYYRETRKIESNMDNSSPDKTYTTGLWTRFTAMVQGPAKTDGQAAKKSLNFTIGEYENNTIVTGINIIGANGQQKEYIDLTNKVYNLNGQVVRSDSTDLKGLPAGVYVVKGKKFVVK